MDKITRTYQKMRWGAQARFRASSVYSITETVTPVSSYCQNPSRSRLETVKRKLETLTDRLSELPRGISAEPIYAQMKRLNDEKMELETQIQERNLKLLQPRMPAHLNGYTALLDRLEKITPGGGGTDFKADVIKALVHKIEVKANGIRFHFYAGDQEIRRAKEGPRRGFMGSEKISSFDGSKSLCNGA